MGTHVEQEPADELVGRQGHDFGPVALAPIPLSSPFCAHGCASAPWRSSDITRERRTARDHEIPELLLYFDGVNAASLMRAYHDQFVIHKKIVVCGLGLAYHGGQLVVGGFTFGMRGLAIASVVLVPVFIRHLDQELQKGRAINGWVAVGTLAGLWSYLLLSQGVTHYFTLRQLVGSQWWELYRFPNLLPLAISIGVVGILWRA